ncbi:GlgC family sugar phosphate nucleotidyltransferase [Desulfomarina profundi]
MDHRGIRDQEPALLEENAVVQNSLLYNGCKVAGSVRNSILFPGVHVRQGAVVENSVLFFDNSIGENCRLNTVVSDVNTSFGAGANIGAKTGSVAEEITVIGWNNEVPDNIRIGAGAVVHPRRKGKWPEYVRPGEVLK